jgi:tRNA pseudouridine55 synthase
MVILIGKATKLCDSIMAGRKRYIAEIDLSRTSDTDDLEGNITPVEVALPPPREQIESVLRAKFTGAIMQAPPAHSAVWIEGQRAYDLARARKAPQMQARPVQVHSIDILDYHWPRLRLDIACGKGTYIRSLARDIGRDLGVGGMLVGLRRTEVAPYSIEQAIALDDVPDPLRPEHLRQP